MNDLEFNDRIRRIAHLLFHGQDTSSFDPFEVEAAKIYLKDHVTRDEDSSEDG